MYVVKRVIYIVLTMWLIVTATFFLMKLMPGTPFDEERFLRLLPSQQATIMAQYGLDKPLGGQYLQYIDNILHWDLGVSFTYNGRKVSDLIRMRIPPSALVGAQAILVGLGIGLALGIIAAWRHNSIMDNMTMILAILGVSIPNFVVAALLQYFVGLRLGILPVAFWESWTCSIMPSIALCFSPLSSAARFIRTEMLDVLSQDYIITARSKGMSRMRLMMKHTLRNSIIPVVTIFGPMVVNLMTGSLAVESIFSIPGIGSLFTDSVRNNDYPVIMGLTIFFSLFYITVTFLVDVAYGIIDPRIRLAGNNSGA
ncbi:MAG: ABC transporter permease [Treponema sp.]|jgi:oligopeptide transport system permease protein|nr:ABC transporter permease [Treponema sp.]